MASSSTSEPKKKIKLKTADNDIFDVDEDVALQSETIKNMLEAISGDQIIPLPNLNSYILAKFIEYCSNQCPRSPKIDLDDKSVDDANNKEFDWEWYLLHCDQDTLFDIMLAANYLHIKSLLDLTCKCVADMINGKKPEEIRKKFHIINDYTPEEEEEIRAEMSWAFE